ncbi:MAG: tetraacyldisaccharide 4'-kinase [Planctomycetota bacterium]
MNPLLATFESLYRLGVDVENWRRRRQQRRGAWPQRLPRPVLSVGNIVAGGAGKTPVVEALAREWRSRGGHPAILSRGYRGGPQGNDEYQLLRRRIPQVPHRQNPRRYQAGLELLAEHPEIDLFLLDDGFQHRRLHRDLDLVLLDATRPLGYGHCLPRGLLREPWSSLRRADAFLITRQEEASPQKVAILRTFLRQYFRGVPLSTARARCDGVRDPHGVSMALPAEKRWAAFAGVGNVWAFFRTLERLGLPLAGTRSFADHHRYRAAELVELSRWAQSLGADALICTEKDGVKLEGHVGFGELAPPIYQLQFRFEIGSPHPLDLLQATGVKAGV